MELNRVESVYLLVDELPVLLSRFGFFILAIVIRLIEYASGDKLGHFIFLLL